MRGRRAERAFEVYSRITPAYHEDMQERHRMEPYVYSQMAAGRDTARPGEAKNSWLTGTAAWSFVAVSQWILGIRPDWDGLRIEPCLPARLQRVEVTRVFRGCTYRITIDNRGRAPGERRLLVQGAAVGSTVVAPGPPGSEVRVEVET